MDYNALLELVTDIGYRLAMCGAETFRIEDSINHILLSYGISAESFAIPNYLVVSIESPDGQPITRMRRIGAHGNDLDAVEKYSNLSRRICQEKPDLATAKIWLKETDAARRQYSFLMYLIGNFLGASGFAILFGGSFADCLCAGLCGLIVGLTNRVMDKLHTNLFFRTIAAAFLMSVAAYLMRTTGFADNGDTVIIGALMILVPGLLFTNAMRDIIYGDTNSGINRIVQVFLIAAAIALGTGAAWNLINYFFDISFSVQIVNHPLWLQCIATFVACVGFFILFNIHGPGGFLCALGGMLTWLSYDIALKLGAGDITAYFCAAIIASVYAEVMARIRKYPAISYLVISVFPLIPGAGVYYMMNYAVQGDMANFSAKGLHTVAIAGAMAVGILFASTLVRIWTTQRNRK